MAIVGHNRPPPYRDEGKHPKEGTQASDADRHELGPSIPCVMPHSLRLSTGSPPAKPNRRLLRFEACRIGPLLADPLAPWPSQAYPLQPTLSSQSCGNAGVTVRENEEGTCRPLRPHRGSTNLPARVFLFAFSTYQDTLNLAGRKLG